MKLDSKKVHLIRDANGSSEIKDDLDSSYFSGSDFVLGQPPV